MAQKNHIKRFLLDNLSHHKKLYHKYCRTKIWTLPASYIETYAKIYMIKEKQVIAQGRTKDRIYTIVSKSKLYQRSKN